MTRSVGRRSIGRPRSSSTRRPPSSRRTSRPTSSASVTVSTGSRGSTTCSSSTTPSSSSHGPRASASLSFHSHWPHRGKEPHRVHPAWARLWRARLPHRPPHPLPRAESQEWLRHGDDVRLLEHPSHLGQRLGRDQQLGRQHHSPVQADERRRPSPRRPLPLPDFPSWPSRALLVLGNSPLGTL